VERQVERGEGKEQDPVKDDIKRDEAKRKVKRTRKI